MLYVTFCVAYEIRQTKWINTQKHKKKRHVLTY